MDNLKTNSWSSKVGLLFDNEAEFPQKLKQHLVFKSDQLSNPFKFIGGLMSKGVLCDGSNYSEANFGLKEMMVRLAMIMACTKGADGIDGLMEALEESGNSQLISDLGAWIKESYGVETECNFGEPKGDDDAAVPTPTPNPEALAKQMKTGNKMSSYGTKLIDNIMSRVEYDFMEQLEGHLVDKAPNIANAQKFCSNLVRLKVLDETDMQLSTGPQAQDGQQIEKAIKAACSKRAIGSLVVALQNSENERIVVETCDWLETSQARQKNYPISVKSLARERRTGLFAATQRGLVSVDLQTLEDTALTSEYTFAVAVNHKLKKVYWTETHCNSSIVRSDFDGSNKEVIIPPAGDWIYTLAIDEPSGNIYFALFQSHEIKVCNALGKNCAVVLSSSSLINDTVSIALDSVKGLMYWGNRKWTPHSLVRANLDGSNATIISTGFKNLWGITLDQTSNDVIYVTDYAESTIETFGVNGGNRRTLVKLEGNPGPQGIQVDDHKFYIGTWSGKNVQSVERDSGAKLTTIFHSSGGLNHVALFNTP